MIDHAGQLTNTRAQRAEMPLRGQPAAAARRRRASGSSPMPGVNGGRVAAFCTAYGARVS